MKRTDNQFLMLTHVSQFANIIFPFGGLIVPLVLWQMKKEEVEGMEEHGKAIVNFQISFAIYTIISCILMILIIGIGFLLIIALLTVIFPVIGAVKAANGEFYKYPLTIQFVK